MLETGLTKMKTGLRSILSGLATVVFFSALVAVTTLVLQIPLPVIGSHITFGDTMIMVTALFFGSTVGGLVGSLGSAFADMVSYPLYAPCTLLAKGVGGFIAGRLRKGTICGDSFACILAGICMITVYIIMEVLTLRIPIEEALLEIPSNSIQVIFATAIGPPITHILRGIWPSNLTTSMR